MSCEMVNNKWASSFVGVLKRSENRTARTDLICGSKTPPTWLDPGVFIFKIDPVALLLQ